MSDTRRYAGKPGSPTVADGPEQTQSDGGPQSAMPRAGERLGRYRLLSELGAGGMGVVFEGHDPELDRRVAVKVLRRDGVAEDVARVVREARAVAQLSHPNVVQVFDVSATEGRPYIVMEYVQGRTLSSWAAEGQSWKRVVGVFIKAASGLAAAHEAGLVHRDFKPANVLVTEKRDVKVLDFGLARPDREAGRAASEDELPQGLGTLTQSGIAMGTPAYMAPEQHVGDPVTARADIYAFGVALYEALYGERPFSGRDTASLVRQKKRGIPGAPSSADVPAELHEVICKAAAFDPEERFGSMKALAAALRKAGRRTPRFASVALWGAALVGIGGAAAVLALPADSEPAAETSTETPAVVARDVGVEAARLVTLCEEQARRGELAESLGTAYGAFLVASAAQSDSALGAAEVAVASRLIDNGRYNLTQTWLRRGIEHLERAEQWRDFVQALSTLAQTLAVTNLESDATRVLRRANAALERHGLSEDANLRLNLLVAEAMIVEWDDPTKSIEIRERAVAILRKSPEAVDGRRRGTILANLGRQLRYSDPKRAAELLKEGIDELVTAGGENQPVVYSFRVGLADMLRLAGEHDACLRSARAVFDGGSAVLPGTRLNASSLAAVCLTSAGDYESALEWANRSVDIAEKIDGSEDSVLSAASTRGWILLELGRHDEAEADLLRVLVYRETHAEAGSLSEVLMLLGRAAFETQELERAENYFRRAVESAVERDSSDAEVLHTHFALGIFLVRTEAFEEGLASLERGLAMELPEGFALDENFLRAEGFKGRALWAVGKKREGLALARDAYARIEKQSPDSDYGRELAKWIAAHSND